MKKSLRIRTSDFNLSCTDRAKLSHDGQLSFRTLQSLFYLELSRGRIAYLPFGMVLKNLIVTSLNQALDKVGGAEISLPVAMEPRIVKRSKRAAIGYFRRHAVELKDEDHSVLMPTHEEAIAHLFSEIGASARNQIWFQYGQKTRKEEAPSFPVRLLEFCMHDTYSFSPSEREMDEVFDKIVDAILNSLEVIGLNVSKGEETTGRIFGDRSIELLSPVLSTCGNHQVELEIGHAYKLNKSYGSLIDLPADQQPFITGTGVGVDRLVFAMLSSFWEDGRLNLAKSSHARRLLSNIAIENDDSWPESTIRGLGCALGLSFHD